MGMRRRLGSAARCVVGDERDDSEKKVTLRPRFGQ